MMLDRRRTDSYVGYVVEIMNELTIVLLSYVMMGYGMFVLEGKVLNEIGRVNIVLILACIGVNAIVLIFSSIRTIYRWLKYKFCQWPSLLKFKRKFKPKAKPDATFEQPSSKFKPTF